MFGVVKIDTRKPVGVIVPGVGHICIPVALSMTWSTKKKHKHDHAKDANMFI